MAKKQLPPIFAEDNFTPPKVDIEGYVGVLIKSELKLNAHIELGVMKDYITRLSLEDLKAYDNKTKEQLKMEIERQFQEIAAKPTRDREKNYRDAADFHRAMMEIDLERR